MTKTSSSFVCSCFARLKLEHAIIRRPLPSLGLGGAPPGIAVASGPFLCYVHQVCFYRVSKVLVSIGSHAAISGPQSPFYRVSKLPVGTFRPALNSFASFNRWKLLQLQLQVPRVQSLLGSRFTKLVGIASLNL